MDPRANWTKIRMAANSCEEFDRASALTWATGSVELALTEAGFASLKKHQGLFDRVASHGLLGRRGWPSESDFRAALWARNTAAHGGRGNVLPTRDETKVYVRTLRKCWEFLRQLFVTKKTASALAQRIFDSGRVEEVYLYGSLARPRSGRDPHDIDLLLLGDSYLAAMGVGYEARTSEYLLEELDLLDETTRAAVHSGWLDILAIDAVRFGIDTRYVRLVAQQQSDSLFFVNIATDAVRFKPGSLKWDGDRRPIFARLALLRAHLETEGIVDKPWKRRPRASAKGAPR